MGVGQDMRGGQLAAAAGLVLTIESTHLLTKRTAGLVQNYTKRGRYNAWKCVITIESTSLVQQCNAGKLDAFKLFSY